MSERILGNGGYKEVVSDGSQTRLAQIPKPEKLTPPIVSAEQGIGFLGRVTCLTFEGGTTQATKRYRDPENPERGLYEKVPCPVLFKSARCSCCPKNE